MTTRSASESHSRALANQPVPLSNAELLDKYDSVFNLIWAAAGQGLFYLNVKLLDTQYDELTPIIQNQGFGISLALPTSVETYATNTTGITVTGSIGNGAGGSGNLLIVTEAEDLGLTDGITIVGNSVSAGTYITSTTPDYTLGITGGSKEVKTFTANVSNNSFTLSNVSDFKNVVVNAKISGTNIVDGTVVSSFDTIANTITLSIRATGTSSGITVSFPIFTVFTQASGGWTVGMKVVIAGQAESRYNQMWTISGTNLMNPTTQFQVTPDNTWTDPPAPTTGGTVRPTGLSGGVGYYAVNNSQSIASRDLSSYWFTLGNTQGMVPNAKINFSGTSVSTRAFQTFTNGNIAVDSTDNLYPGMPVRFLGSSLGGIVAYKTYYIVTAVSGLLTVSEDNASGVIETWADDATYTMSVTAGGTFGGVTSGKTYYIHSVPDAVHVVVSETIGGKALALSSSIGYMSVIGGTAASNLISPTPIYSGPDAVGYLGNDYIISW